MAGTGVSKNGLSEGRGLVQRFAIWRASRGPAASGFAIPPEPHSIGMVARGRQLLEGNYLFAGQLVQAPGHELWQISPPALDFAQEMQGFTWLEDLAAMGDQPAREKAQAWVQEWIVRFGKGRGPGWTAQLTGRRLQRLLHHAGFLQDVASFDAKARLFATMTTQTRYLAQVWEKAAPGLPRFEALAALTAAALSLRGLEGLADPAITALQAEARREIAEDGGIASRNPEELLEIFTLLTWTTQALTTAKKPIPEALQAAIARMAPTLRLLRHADGRLARFHDGGKGPEGRLDQALAIAAIKPAPVSSHSHGPLMGYVRMFAGRSSLVVDVASPPEGQAGKRGHASTLAMELTSGRRPLIVSCGSGAPFGKSWRQAGRATPSHSTLCIEGVSSSRFVRKSGEVLADRAKILSLRQMETETGAALHAAHDGWAETHGLSHARDLAMTVDGRHIAGSDTLIALNPKGRARFDTVMARTEGRGVSFAIRFHLHPDVDATLDMGGNAVSMALKSGEIWVFRHDGQGKLTLEPSVYLEKGRFEPRSCKQFVLSGFATQIETRIGWTLAKAQDTPLAIRDLDREDLPVSL